MVSTAVRNTGSVGTQPVGHPVRVPQMTAEQEFGQDGAAQRVAEQPQLAEVESAPPTVVGQQVELSVEGVR
jgi:hypothetical protein